MLSGAQLFEIIYKRFLKIAAERGLNPSKASMTKFLGISHGKMQQWERGTVPKAADMAVLVDRLGFNAHWLVTGEGEPYAVAPQAGQPPPSAPAPSPHPDSAVHIARPLPMVGLASCGVNGWAQMDNYAATAQPITLGPRAVAVVAAGESMVPAGIMSGMICYADPDQPAGVGDAVFVARADRSGTIKLFLGRGARDGYIRLKGWLPPDKAGKREEFTMDELESQITTMAPVLYVRRRI